MTETVQDLVEAYLKARRWQNRRWYNPKGPSYVLTAKLFRSWTRIRPLYPELLEEQGR